MSGNEEHGIKKAEQVGVMIEPGGIGRGASFSGGETNHYWKNVGGDFLELSAISGADHSGDSRGFALFDYDRDGYQDFVMVNANRPFVQLFRNRQGDVLPPAARAMPLRIRFEGGNRAAEASAEWSNRDGYGAKVRVTAGDLRLVREHRCGEGLGTQNSATMMVGIGGRERADRVEVEWPSGRRSVVEDVAQGSLVTFYENPAHSPDGSGVDLGEVAPAPTPSGATLAGTAEDVGLGYSPVLARLAEGRTEAPFRLYMTWFTTCSACKRAAPTVDALRRAFAPEELAIFGFNNDGGDSVKEMEAYREKYAPAYDMLLQRTDDDIRAVKTLIDRVLEPLEQGGRVTEASNVTPTTVLTDARGNVLWASYGVPTVSELKRLLHDEFDASAQ